MPEGQGAERPKDLVYEMGMTARHPERLANDLAVMGGDAAGMVVTSTARQMEPDEAATQIVSSGVARNYNVQP